MTVVIGAGTAGCRLAPYVADALGVGKVTLVDTPDGVASGERRAKELGLDVRRVKVAYGSPSGAHRNFRKAMEGAEKSRALRKLIKAFRKAAAEAYRQDRVPVIVWGLGGATGAATAIRLSEALGKKYVCHVTVLPDYKQEHDYPRRLLGNAAEQLRIFENSLQNDVVVTGDFAGRDLDRVGEHYNHILRDRRDLADIKTAQNANYTYSADGKRKVRTVFMISPTRDEVERVQLPRLIRRLEELRDKVDEYGKVLVGGALAVERGEEDVDMEMEDISDDVDGEWDDVF